tara:strand:- start:486 stop:719 length:234 start_codon:yes stop_codon:yes gene_type:complete
MGFEGHCYTVYGNPFIKPYMFTSLELAYNFVESIKPKGSKTNKSYNSLANEFKGKYLKIKIIEHKVKNKKIEIFISK